MSVLRCFPDRVPINLEMALLELVRGSCERPAMTRAALVPVKMETRCGRVERMKTDVQHPRPGANSTSRLRVAQLCATVFTSSRNINSQHSTEHTCAVKVAAQRTHPPHTPTSLTFRYSISAPGTHLYTRLLDAAWHRSALCSAHTPAHHTAPRTDDAQLRPPSGSSANVALRAPVTAAPTGARLAASGAILCRPSTTPSCATPLYPSHP